MCPVYSVNDVTGLYQGTLAPFQGADNFSLRSGGLRRASTTGYSLPTLRVATILPARLPK